MCVCLLCFCFLFLALLEVFIDESLVLVKVLFGFHIVLFRLI